MAEAASALGMFDKYGLLGLMIGAFIGTFVLLLLGMKWYIKSDREFKAEQDIRHNAQYERRLDVEKEWRGSLDRNSGALHALAAALNQRPCIGGGAKMVQERRRSDESDHSADIMRKIV